jgi:hypothetical protein
LYFKHSGETNSASKIAEHVDVRGEGGFVVAPPSIVGSHLYRFLVLPNSSRLQPFPQELLNAERHIVSGIGGKSNDWLSQALEGIREGNRNDTFAKLVGRLHRDKHSPSNILALLRPHAELHAFPIGELENVIQSVTRYENESGQRTSYEIHAQEGKAENLEKFLEGVEKVNWIVPGLIANSSIGFAAGLPESLKTWILIDLAIECARGGSWLGNKVNKNRVLFIDQERFIGETRRRFKKMLKGKNISVDEDINRNLIVQVGSSIRLNLDVSFDAFRKKLSDIRPDLIIVDSFATFSTVAENDRQEVQKVIERIKQLRQEFGCTVLMIDHENKSVLSPDNVGKTPDAYSMIGSVGKPAAAELVLTVRKETDSSVTIYNTKNSLAPSVAPITVQLVDTENGGVKLEQL